MPREYLHWKILEDSFNNLSSSTLPGVAACLDKNLDMARLGAMAHDAPYFYKMGTSTEATQFSEVLHGAHGEDTLEPFRLIGENIPKLPTKELQQTAWSFVLGMLTHYVTDSIFHPMIYSVTGNYYASESFERKIAVTNHRLLETMLDLWIRDKYSELDKINFISLLKSTQNQLGTIYALLDTSLASLDQGVKKTPWEGAFFYMSYLQYAFLSPTIGKVARIINTIFNHKFDESEVTFAAGRMPPESMFAKKITYTNPITKEDYEKSVLELREDSVEEILKLFTIFESAVNGTPIREVLSNKIGVSLNFGIPQTPVQGFTYLSSDLDLLENVIKLK